MNGQRVLTQARPLERFVNFAPLKDVIDVVARPLDVSLSVQSPPLPVPSGEMAAQQITALVPARRVQSLVPKKDASTVMRVTGQQGANGPAGTLSHRARVRQMNRGVFKMPVD